MAQREIRKRVFEGLRQLDGTDGILCGLKWLATVPVAVQLNTRHGVRYSKRRRCKDSR